jgi:succinate dehydrogenase / fumarate reductase membrane anchor subunit
MMTGLKDWIIQRVSAVILAGYLLFIFGITFIYSPLHYFSWKAIFQHHSVKVFTILALLSLIAHAWIGLWTITTDYFKPLALRFLTQLCILFALFFYVFWGLSIIWRI